MKNPRELFNLYHNGFQDFGPWLDHHLEMHTRHPLDVPEFGAEWLRRWEAVGRLLNTGALRHDWSTERGWHETSKSMTVAFWLLWGMLSEHFYPNERRRVVLLNGTIIREWGAK